MADTPPNVLHATQSEQALEDALVAQLVRQGYAQVAVTDEASMLANLKAQLEAFNGLSLTAGEFSKVLNHLNRKAGVFEKAKTLRDRMKLDKPGMKGYAVGFQGLVEFINGLVPSNEVIDQALRREVKMFPEIAGRELVANALIHQDFTESGTSTVIEIYDDRMEIFNPGKPFISPDRIRATYQHCCLRNVMNERMTNQSLRERFRLSEKKAESVSRAIWDTIEAGMIKLADPEQKSLRYRHYLPFWA